MKEKKFYKTLLELRKRNEALSANTSFKKVLVGDEKAVYAYVRKKEIKSIRYSEFFWNWAVCFPKESSLLGKAYNVFEEKEVLLNAKERKMKPWGYEIYEY